jgi:hypothetical protein
MLSLHDEVERSPVPRWNRQVLHRVLTGTRVTKPLRRASTFFLIVTGTTTSSQSLLVTRREYRMQEMCVQYFFPTIGSAQSSLPMPHHGWQVRILRTQENFFLEFQRSGSS